MTRVNVDDVAFMDRRFKLLGGRLGITWQEALGRCLPVWALAYVRRSTVLPAADVDALAERPGFAAAMIDVELAVDHGGGVYLCGVGDRIDFLLVQDAKREKAREAKLRAAGVSRPPKPSRGTARAEPGAESSPGIRVPGASPGTVPEVGPYSPDLDLAPDLDRDRDPPARPRTYDPAEPAARGQLAEATYQRVSAARLAIAAELQLPEQLPFPPITPSTRPRAFVELLDRVREEGAAAPAACDRVVENLIAQARDTRDVEWLSQKAFGPGAWATARERVPGKRSRSAPANVGRVEPHAPSDYGSGDQDL